MNEWYLLLAFIAGMAVGQHITIKQAIAARAALAEAVERKDAALRLALEALEYADACLSNQLSTRTKHEYSIDWCKDAIAAIKESLE